MVERVSTFAMPSEYERAAMEARRRKRMAEMLAQQAYDPSTVQNAPIPSAAPLVQGLQAFLTARQQRKAEEAAEKAEKADVAQMRELLTNLGPQERSGAEAAPTGQARQDMLLAAMAGGSPRAAKLAEMLMGQKPEVEEFGTTPVLSESGEYVVFGKGGTARPTGVRGAPKSANMPSAVQEYEYAKSQGYTGSFADWELRNRQAGAARFVLPSEGERKDSYNLGRIVNAVETIKNATTAEPAAVKPGLKETVVGALPFVDEASYLAQSPQRQIVTSAQTDLIDAALTLATGAAYTKEQLAGQRQALLPRFGESKESIAAKSKRVEALISAAKVRAGRAWTPELEASVRSAFSTPDASAAPVSSAPPTGVTAAEWAVMTPEERALWQK